MDFLATFFWVKYVQIDSFCDQNTFESQKINKNQDFQTPEPFFISSKFLRLKSWDDKNEILKTVKTTEVGGDGLFLRFIHAVYVGSNHKNT